MGKTVIVIVGSVDRQWASVGPMSAPLLCQRWAVNGGPTSVNIGQTSNEPMFSTSIQRMPNLEKLSSVWEYTSVKGTCTS